jgi:hypothetical protein
MFGLGKLWMGSGMIPVKYAIGQGQAELGSGGKIHTKGSMGQVWMSRLGSIDHSVRRFRQLLD